ncbi:HLH transcription factor [Histoplasma capsulatum G186AR]|uniref:HLH transcription factor n=1 Tax=Ajellomyces capsulatus TaxID=5037 RepID=A0A8H8CRQ5_AJECA|nr:HLH transcription factor [Histoplasma capsulatum]QSS70877.1 HLH transcription factor [Histoplasma capsulatum G186AR]
MPLNRRLSPACSVIAAFPVNIQPWLAKGALATAATNATRSPLSAPGRAARVNTVPFPCAGPRPPFPRIHTPRFTMRNRPRPARLTPFQTPTLLARPTRKALVRNPPVSLTGEAAPRSL